MSTAVSAIIFFLFGAVIGSFLNVVSLRFGTGVGLGGRSSCMTCGRKLRALELIPIVSFLAQLGRCRNCKSKISWQYPLVEIATGLIFALLVIKFPPVTPLAAYTVFLYVVASCFLMVITAYDIKHKIIPDNIVFTFNTVALFTVFTGGTAWFHAPHIWTFLAGPIAALPFALLWLVSRGRWIGLGDAKLMLGIGWILGLNGVVNAVVLSFWVGAAISLIWMLVTYKRFKSRVEIPFGPYLILGMYLVLFFDIVVIDLRMLVSLF